MREKGTHEMMSRTRRKDEGRPSLLLLAVVLLLSVGTIWQINDLKNDQAKTENALSSQTSLLSKEKDRSDSFANSQNDAAKKTELLAQQVRDLGGRPVVSPAAPITPGSGPTGATGATGATGRAPTAAEIALAVRSYCSDGRCNGKSPTAAQVAAAVTEYCVGDKCRGPVGSSGSDGADGSTGAQGDKGAQGDPGPGPTDEQVAAAVVTYCAEHGDCKGPQGENGNPGAGLTAVETIGCENLEGKTSLSATYDPITGIVTITCT